MYILGLNLIHDTSAALIKDGEIIGAVEEERFNRDKHTEHFPKNAINWLLSKENIKLSQIDHVVTSFRFSDFIDNDCPFEENTLNHDDASNEGFKKIKEDNLWLSQKVKRELKEFGIKEWEEVPHHLAHAYGAYFQSNFDETNILVIDGRGEKVSTSLYFAKNGKINLIEDYPIKDSLGHLYSYVTKICGLYSGRGQEGKTMGLAAYGEFNNEMEELFNKIISIENDRYEINRNEMRKLTKYLSTDDTITNASKSLAKHVQIAYENVLLFLVKKLCKITGNRKLVMSGGVALNCEGNRKILESGLIDEVYIQSAANDAGTAIGAALYSYHQKNKQKKINISQNLYLGPEYSREEIEKVLKLSKINYEIVEDIEKLTAQYLSLGMIVGWFQGRMEFGPRALGNRSILADPRDVSMKAKINKYVKQREEWRPFAPSILYEKLNDYVDLLYESPNMTLSYKIKKDKINEIPAAVHIDGTCRFQTVTEENNQRFYKLIKEFYDITGVPVLLNTSFNGPEPIVCSPIDALKTFYTSGLDILVIENFIIKKRDVNTKYYVNTAETSKTGA